MRDDLQQWNAGPVVVDKPGIGAVDAPVLPTHVGRLAGVFLHVSPLDADPHATGKVEMTVSADRLVVLADLVVLRLVRIKIVLPVKRRWANVAVQREAKADGFLDRFTVEHRKRPGQAKADLSDVGVRFVAKPVWSAREQLRLSVELNMNFKTDDGLPGDASFDAIRVSGH